MSIDASVVLPDGRTYAAMIRDVFANGCRVDCDEVLPVAETVRLDLGDDTIEAEVRWALAGAAGLQLVNRSADDKWAQRRR